MSHLAGINELPSVAGEVSLREAVRKHLLPKRGISCDAYQVVITAGMQEALRLEIALLVEAGDELAVEAPGYPPLSELLRLKSAKVSNIPVDE